MLWLAVPATIVLSVLQVAAVPSFGFFGVHADLLVVWIGCWAALRGLEESVVLIGVAGLSLGFMAPEPLGAALLALLPLAGFAALVETPLARSRFLFALFSVMICGLLYPLLLAAAGVLGGDSLGPPRALLTVAPRVAILDGVIAAAWFWPLRLALVRRRPAGRFIRA